MGVGLPFNPYRAILCLFIALILVFGFFTHVSDVPLYGKLTVVQFTPTSYDWANHSFQHPIPRENMTYPPRGDPHELPSIQHQFFRPPEEGEQKDALNDKRSDVRRAFRRSWYAYEQYAWGHDELRPLSLTGHDNLGGWGASMIDALDTLWLMDMESEFHEAVRYVVKIDWNQTVGDSFDVFETTARHLGGLLSAYELSEEKGLLHKAIELGDLLYAAFDNEEHIPSRKMTFEDHKQGKGRPDTKSSASELGSMSLEFTRLSQLTDDPKYYDVVNRIAQSFDRTQNSTLLPGLWPTQINARDDFRPDGDTFNFADDSSSLYNNIVKEYVFLQGQEPMYKKMYQDAVDTIIGHLLFRPILLGEADLLMLGQAEVVSSSIKHFHAQLDHASCSAGGMIALGGKVFGHDEHVVYGDKLARACAYAYSVFPHAIMPDSSLLQACPDLKPCEYRPNSGARPAGFRVREGKYTLRPEAIESVFILYRITGNEDYRALAWDMWESIKRTTKTDEAFAAVEDVTKEQTKHVDEMGSYWMGETLKYFYLMFSDEDLLNLDRWVFSTGGHAMRKTGSS
ncbi:glycoside hydrolase [Thelonectria olida]|uniref:alpha-1,2-Mannosidase n=1 Tax=Thelonectria olida TaxID=1576542 RepID=A0A9P9AMB4_9HYPO|nr:glycoside hydrolase [Thelonectria olida]